MRLLDWFLQLLMLPVYIAIFLLAAAPGLIKGTLDVVTAPFVIFHEEAHLRTARLLDVEYQQVNALTWAYPNASASEILVINLAPLVLIVPSIFLFMMASNYSFWVFWVMIGVAVGLARYSLPSRIDLISIRAKYALSITHVFLLPLVLFLYLLRIPRRFSVLLDYLVEIAWVVGLYLAVEQLGYLLSVALAGLPF